MYNYFKSLDRNLRHNMIIELIECRRKTFRLTRSTAINLFYTKMNPVAPIALMKKIRNTETKITTNV